MCCVAKERGVSGASSENVPYLCIKNTVTHDCVSDVGRVVNNGNAAVSILMPITLRCTAQGEQGNSRRADTWPFSPGAAARAVFKPSTSCGWGVPWGILICHLGDLCLKSLVVGGVPGRQSKAALSRLRAAPRQQSLDSLLSLQGTGMCRGTRVIPAGAL